MALSPPPSLMRLVIDNFRADTTWKNWLYSLYEYVRDNVGKDFFLEVSKGNVEGHYPLNKFGVAVEGIQTTPTDVWDRADASATQQIWLAPTAARIHTIASTSANDTTGGTGANSVQVYYLPDWDSVETSEVITGNLNAGIAMTNAAVIIHRMKVIPQSTSTTVNAGIITATAAVDATITAQINVGAGQTQMAIYGFPSTQTLHLTRWYAAIHKSSGGAVDAFFNMLVNPSPDLNTVIFLKKEVGGLESAGTSSDEYTYKVTKKFPGPGIIKIQSTASAADVEAAAGFDAVLVDN